jgi:hypothetical protein
MFAPILYAGLLSLAPSTPVVVAVTPEGAVCAALSPTPAGTAITRSAPGASLPDDELRAIYEGGAAYPDFLEHATRRVDMWESNTEEAEGIDPSLVARARAVGGTWRFLAVAVDSCSDSVSTIPYLAQRVAMVDGLDLRIVDSTVGRGIMESHRTPDGRPSTPTVLLIDAAWEEAGCFIERPPKLQTWLLESAFSGDEVFPRKMAWYAEDAGQNTVEAFVEMLEAAARGETICR